MQGPFQNPDFRKLFLGRIITNIGDSFYFVGAMWLVYSLTGDPLYTGVAGFVTMAPQVFQFAAGPLVDKWSIRRTLVGTQLIQAAVVSLIPIAHSMGLLTVELVLVVMPVLSALNQLVYPAQVTALPRILDDEELVAANSAFATAYQGFEMVANGIGGVLIGLFGAVTLFALDAVTFGIAALIFASVSIPPAKAAAMGTTESKSESLPSKSKPHDSGSNSPDTNATDRGMAENEDEPMVGDGGTKIEDDSASEESSYLTRLREGLGFVQGTFLMWLVAGSAVVNITYGMVLAAMPVYADTLELPAAMAAVGAAGVYGVLMASLAAGTLVGALSASQFSEMRIGMSMVVAYPVAALLWTGALVVNWLPLTAFLLALSFVPNAIVAVQISAVLQSVPPEHLVGRVSSIFGSASASMIPVGALLGGVVAGQFGPQVAMAAMAVGSFGFGLYVLLNANLRRLPVAHEITVE